MVANGQEGLAKKKFTQFATIPAGYAGGFNRLFSNRGQVLVKGRAYPVVGRVGMDQSMANLQPGQAAAVLHHP